MILEELVNEHYDSLSANDREMLTHIFREKQSVRRMNSTQLAAFLHVSRTTLVRLMRKLGIDTYTEFKLLWSGRRRRPRPVCSIWRTS